MCSEAHMTFHNWPGLEDRMAIGSGGIMCYTSNSFRLIISLHMCTDIPDMQKEESVSLRSMPQIIGKETAALGVL